MATSSTKTLTYDKFEAGEFGTHAASKAPDGSWTGRNVVVYNNGRIGPRPGLKIVDQGVPSPLGKMTGFGFSPVGQTGDTPIFFIIGTKVWLMDPGGTSSLVSATGTLDASPGDNPIQSVLSKESVRLIGDEVYFSIDNDQTYRLNCRTQTLTAIADSPQGTDIETYRDRMLVASGNVRVFFSAVADFDDWPSGDFFDVGPSWRVINMTEFRDSLVIFTASGTWVMTGTADDGTLRRLSDTLPPQDKAVVKTNDDIVYVPVSRAAPVSYNGSYGDEQSMVHLDNWTSAGRPCYGVQSYGNRDVLFLADNGKLLWRKNEAWSYHQMTPDVGPWITRYFDDAVLLANPGSGSNDPDFYMLQMNIDRPASTSDTWAMPGDNSDVPVDAHFSLPDYFDPAGRQFRVRQVTVDFIKYDTGASENNNLDLKVEALGRLHLDGNGDETYAASFNEDGSGVAAGGVRDRLVLPIGRSGYHGGFRVSLNNIKGVSIDRICVDVETEEARPRG